MAEPWLDIIGIGEDGEAGLSAASLAVLKAAEVIVGGDRHQRLATNPTAQRISWPSPFDAMIDTIVSFKGKKLVVLVTGDPLWYSVGARISRAVPADEIRFHPQLSAFQLAACRMGWSLADIVTATIHGRPASQILPHLAPRIRMIVLTKDKSSPATVAKILKDRGFGASRMTALAAMGGKDEKRFDGIAESWSHEVPDFHVLAIECVAGPDAVWYPRTGGLPDEAFVHDGKMTKREVRALTLAKLGPFPDAVLWDVGAGCGSVAIEWMRSAREARAIAIEPLADRCEMIAENARNLGTEKIEIVAGLAPEKLAGLPHPDAIFIGGGLTSGGVVEACWDCLIPGGRMVANAVTLESIGVLQKCFGHYGGELVQISASRAVPVGGFHGWKPAMPVTQWVVVKPMGEST